MCCAFSSRTCPDAFGASAESASAMTMPCCTSRLAIVRMSARSGRLASTSGSAVNRLAAINGNAAFLAPPIGSVSDRSLPPRRAVAPLHTQALLDAQADLDREDDRDRLLCGIFGRLIGVGAAPCIDSGAVAINGWQARVARLLERVQDGRGGTIRHWINCRAAPHHHSLQYSEFATAIAINVCFIRPSADSGKCPPPTLRCCDVDRSTKPGRTGWSSRKVRLWRLKSYARTRGLSASSGLYGYQRRPRADRQSQTNGPKSRRTRRTAGFSPPTGRRSPAPAAGCDTASAVCRWHISAAADLALSVPRLRTAGLLPDGS